MKILFFSLLTLFGFFFSIEKKEPVRKDHSLIGAWELMSQNGEVIADRRIRIITPGYFVEASYHLFDKRFNGAAVGTYINEEGKLKETFLADTFNPNRVGTTEVSNWEIVGNTLRTRGHRNNRLWIESWRAIRDEENYPLSGTWRIASRLQNGEMSPMPDRARKTLKILSKNRFQWIAFNSETKEFFGTGGGTYDVKDNKYTEHIEFFSRDSTRVGMDLSFDIKLDDEGWHHSGLSSKGDPVNELWVRVDGSDPNQN